MKDPLAGLGLSRPCGGSGRLGSLYLALLFLGLPLCYWNGFFSITEAKAVYFMAVSSLYLAARLLLAALPGRAAAPMLSPDAGASSFLLFALLSLLSSLLFGLFPACLLGADNRYQGAVCFLLYAGVFFFLSREDCLSRLSLWGALAGYWMVALLAALNHLGFDPLGTVAPLSSFDRGRYLSTIGNINFLGAYAVLLLPVWAALACSAPSAAGRRFFALTALPGVFCAMASKSESAVLGLSAAVLLLPVFTGRRAEALRRLPLLLPGLAAAMQLFALLSRHGGGDGFSALTRRLLSPSVSLALAGAGLVLWLLLRCRDEAQLVRLRRLYGWLLLAAACLALLLLLLANTLLPASSLGALAPYLIFSDSWGTDRGRIWRSCLQLFAAFPWPQKLLGGGSGCLVRWDAGHRVFQDALVDAAHNEYLHYLLTSGLLGLGTYLACLFLRCRDTLLRDGSPLSLALLGGCAAYALQAAVNIAQPVTTPLFFALLAVLAARCPRRVP